MKEPKARKKAEEVKREYKSWTYKIRRSKRAKRIRLSISVKDGLVVLAPDGFNEKGIPAILESMSSWITSGLAQVQITNTLLRPTSIELSSIHETWNVNYNPLSSDTLTVKEAEEFSLVVSGDSEEPYTITEALNGWMRQKAQEELIPWLNEISQDHALPFNKVSIRRQKTRWGSCSSYNTINLNQNILFLPAPLVRYLMVHELAHTHHHNHSPAFWKYLNSILPESKRRQKEIFNSYDQVPQWAWAR